ncbi:MAG: hypothetical protein ABJZ55_20335 [Fuerstiella sp.]
MSADAVIAKIEDGRLYRTAEVAELFALSSPILRKWRMERKRGGKVGPEPDYLGGRNVRYAGAELKRWYWECISTSVRAKAKQRADDESARAGLMSSAGGSGR